LAALQWDRAFDRAEGHANFTSTASTLALQWDRAFDRAEGGQRGRAAAQAAGLQWDRAFDRAEGQLRGSPSGWLGSLQWDRAFDRAEGRGGVRPQRSFLGFNGTAHLIARKEAVDDEMNEQLWHASMGPRI